jgi:predicted Zn-dependent protease
MTDPFHPPSGHGLTPSEPAIGPPDSFHLSSAQGWMELGDLKEAALDLAKVGLPWREHSEFLEIEWELEARRKNWAACHAIAEHILERAPESAFGWIHRSYALHELKRTQEAWDALRPLVSRFPELWTIPYNLACYACQLGRLGEAKTWLAHALLVGDARRIDEMARGDPDLAPLMGPPG